MKRLIIAAALAVTAFNANAGATSYDSYAGHRKVEKIAHYECESPDTGRAASLYAGNHRNGGIWVQVQFPQGGMMRFNRVYLEKIEGKPTLISTEHGTELIVRVSSANRSVLAVKNVIYVCDFIEDLNLVSYGR